MKNNSSWDGFNLVLCGIQAALFNKPTRLSIRLSVCLSFCLSVCLDVSQFIFKSSCPSNVIHQSVWLIQAGILNKPTSVLSVCLSFVCHSACRHICLYVLQSVWLIQAALFSKPTRLSICQSLCLSVCKSVCLSDVFLCQFV